MDKRDFRFMLASIRLAVFVVLLGQLANATGRCPVTLVSASGTLDSVSITFMNAGKLPIRRLEFSCKLTGDRSDNIRCEEDNALFYPGMEYTVTYAHMARIPEQVRISLKSLTLADGYVWKPNPAASCRVLRVDSKKK
ncbi:MAG: hypothetical protein WBX02_19760 [Terriglobales bacterium]